MKITVLVENASACGLPAEHGLSLFVETERTRFLFDLGQTDLLARNAETLGIDLDTADFAVLSHGHYDHGGGMKAFFSLNDHAPVYVSRYAFGPHYNRSGRYIGLDPDLERSDRLIRVGDGMPIRPGLTLMNVPGAPGIVPVSPCGLKRLEAGVMRDEDFRHEQYLLAEEGGRRILFSGCSHRGILNILHWFRPDVLIGGFHLMDHPADRELTDIAKQLDAYPTVYYTCHCTGLAQYAHMKPIVRNLHSISTGDSLLL